jgi:hypothetical protein
MGSFKEANLNKKVFNSSIVRTYDAYDFKIMWALFGCCLNHKFSRIPFPYMSLWTLIISFWPNINRIVLSFLFFFNVHCEELLHTFHNKICTHKTQLGVQLLCSCILTSKVVQGNVMKFIKNLFRCVHLEV